MQKFSFEDAVERIAARDPRFAAGAYSFLREALDYTMAALRPKLQDPKTKGHVDGAQLLEGFRRLALERFGPMAMTVLEDWGIHCTGDVGAMVFNLIEEEVFGKTDTDTPEDFTDVYDFHEAFEVPFLPRSRGRQEQSS